MPAGGIRIMGMYRDMLKGPDGAVILDTGWRSNTIVLGCRKLIASMMKNEPAQGIQYLAVGRGEDSWDATPPGPAPEDTEKLVAPYAETIPVDAMQVNYSESGKVTNCLHITAKFMPGFPESLPSLATYPLREFGLYGKFGGEDYMINCVRHGVIHKDKAVTLEREIRLTF